MNNSDLYDLVMQTALFTEGDNKMYIECDPRTAFQIESMLIEVMKCGIIVSKSGSQYCFEFV